MTESAARHPGVAAGIRNLGIIAHIDAGKTSLTEQILKRSGAIRYAGEVSEGTTVTDWLPQERERGISIISAVVTCHWQDVQVNVIDTPGHVDFTAEVERTLGVMDGVVAVLCGVRGVQAQSETVWRRSQRHRIPALAFVNKLDRMGSDFKRVVEQICERFGVCALPIQIPVGTEGSFRGMVDVLTGRLEGEDGSLIEDLSHDSLVMAARERVVEAVADVDDEILSSYLDGESIDADSLRRGLRRGVRERRIVPVLGGSAKLGIGIRGIMEAIRLYLPSPAESCSGLESGKKVLVFKVVREPRESEVQAYVRLYGGSVSPGDSLWNLRARSWLRVQEVHRVFAGTSEPLEGAEAGDIVLLRVSEGEVLTGDTLTGEESVIPLGRMEFPEPVVRVTMELSSSTRGQSLREILASMCREDPTLQVKEGPLAGQWTLSGMGELHLEIVKERLWDDYRIKVVFGKPQVSYRCTVEHEGLGECMFEKRLVTGEVHRAGISLRICPLERGKGVEIYFAASGRSVSEVVAEFVERTLRQLIRSGLGDDRSITDVRIVLEQLSCFEGETTEPALLTACRKALSEAMEAGGPLVLEPVMSVDISVPEGDVGNVLADLMSRRGRVVEVHSTGCCLARIISLVPLGELFGYATSLRSLSGGRGEFVAEPSVYAPLRSC